MSVYDHDDMVATSLRRASVSKIDDTGTQQLANGSGLTNDEFESVYRPQSHGLSAVPPVGSEGLLLSMGGRNERSLLIGCEHKDNRPKGQQPGWTTLYDDKGNVISMIGSNGMKLKSSTDNITVEVPDGKKVFLGGDGTVGSYQRVRTETGLSVNLWARVG